MRILGIDPGSYATGYGILDESGGELQEVAQGTIRPPRGKPFLIRISAIHRAVEDLVAKFRPDEVAVENPFAARNARTAIQLGQARAAALLPAVQSGIPVFEYAPREVKLAVAGTGAAEKHQVARMVTLLLRKARRPDSADSADALAVAICHAHRASGLRRVTRQRR